MPTQPSPDSLESMQGERPRWAVGTSRLVTAKWDAYYQAGTTVDFHPPEV